MGGGISFVRFGQALRTLPTHDGTRVVDHISRSKNLVQYVGELKGSCLPQALDRTSPQLSRNVSESGIEPKAKVKSK